MAARRALAERLSNCDPGNQCVPSTCVRTLTEVTRPPVLITLPLEAPARTRQLEFEFGDTLRPFSRPCQPTTTNSRRQPTYRCCQVANAHGPRSCLHPCSTTGKLADDDIAALGATARLACALAANKYGPSGGAPVVSGAVLHKTTHDC